MRDFGLYLWGLFVHKTMTIIFTLLIIFNIYLLILLRNEQKHRRGIEVILSGILSFSLNKHADKENVSVYKELVYYIKSAIDNAYGGYGFYKLNKEKSLFREMACDEMKLNQIYNEAVEQGATEMRQIERNQNEKNKQV